MRILISGASGFNGNAIRPALAGANHSTLALVRRPPATDEVQWNPGQPLDPQKLAGFDAIVHLAGKSISGRWSEKFKREVRESRVLGNEEDLQKGLGIAGPEVAAKSKLDPSAFF